jgi:hypothetical protein
VVGRCEGEEVLEPGVRGVGAIALLYMVEGGPASAASRDVAPRGGEEDECDEIEGDLPVSFAKITVHTCVSPVPEIRLCPWRTPL